MKFLVTAMVLVFAVSISSCGTEKEDAAAPTGTGPTESAPKDSGSKQASCPDQMLTKGEHAAAVTRAVRDVKIPNSGKLINTQSLYSTDDRTMDDVIVRICAKGLSGDKLKDTATDIAWALKQSPLNKKIATLRVSNYSNDSDPAFKVRNEDFQLNTFDKKTADPGALRAAWKHPNEE